MPRHQGQGRQRAETYWGGVLPHSGRPGRAYAELTRPGAEFDTAGPLVAGLEPDADSTLVHSTPSKWLMQKHPPLATPDGEPDAAAYHRIVAPFYRGAFEAGRHVRIVHARQLHDPRTGYTDHEARARLEPAPGRRTEAAGVRYDEFSNLAHGIPVHSVPGSPLRLPPEATAARWAEALTPTDAEVLASYDHSTSAAVPPSPPAATAKAAASPASPPSPAAASPARWPSGSRPPRSPAGSVCRRPSPPRPAPPPDGRRIHVIHNWTSAPGTCGCPSARRPTEHPRSHPLIGEVMQRRQLGRTLGTLVAATALAAVPMTGAHAYNPTGGILYQLGDEPCLKGRGNCAVYPKSAQLPSGQLVASFEKATVVPETGSADGETLPIYRSDDHGTSWQPLSEVKAPAYLSTDPRHAKYTSNWTNPYLYVLPQAVGKLKKGTLLLASVVTGDDHYYLEHKAADPNWTPSNDGDRSDMAIALYSSTDDGLTWKVENVIATGGWQGGSAGAVGKNIAAANTHRQVDPLWEPYLMVRGGQLVCYYSDENDYLGFDPATGIPQLDPANDTAPDSHGQILVHKTWNGRSTTWSSAVVDIAGLTQDMGGGKTEIGGGRPGMTNVVPTTDGKWLLTYEYWGGGANTRYAVADDPLKFYAATTDAPVTSLPVDTGSRPLATGGSPVVIRLPDGRLVYNAAGSGNVWVNESGRGDGAWKEYQTTSRAGYSRNLQYVRGTGRIAILNNQDTSTIAHAEVDLGQSAGAYYQLVNRRTGQVIGTGNHTNDANIGNGDIPDVVLEDPGTAVNKDTQYWHLTTEPQGGVTLLNKSGGRAAAIWTGNATVGQRIGQWVDNSPTGSWNLVRTADGHYRFQAVKNTGVYLTGASTGAPLTLQSAASDGSQDWRLVRRGTAVAR